MANITEVHNDNQIYNFDETELFHIFCIANGYKNVMQS